jgi:VWFA-related protein
VKTRLAVLLRMAVVLAIANPIPAAQSLAAQTPGAQTFRENVDVGLVTVDLLVTDARGRPIPGLAAGQVGVKVDGRPVRLESFEPPVPPAPGRLPAAPPVAERGAGASASPPVSAAAPPRDFYMAILIDERSSDQSNREVALRQILRFFGDGLPQNVQMLLMTFNGAVHLDCPWSSDLEVIRRCIERITAHRAASLLGPPGKLSLGSASFTPGLDATEAAVHARTSLQGVFEALRVFPEKPGRKGLYVVTDGAPFLAPSEMARELITRAQSNVNRGEPDNARRLALEADRDRDLLLDSLAWNPKRVSMLTEIARLALLRGIEVHPVRSAPRDPWDDMGADMSGGARFPAARGGQPRPSAPLTTDIAAGQAMEEVATTTGGDAVLSRRMFEDGLRHEMASRDSAYGLSFRDPFPGDHRFHRIEIEVDGGGDLRYRRGYRVLDVRESLIESAVNRLRVPADENPLGVRLNFESRGMKNGIAEAEITIAFPAPPEAGGAPSAAGSVRILGFCAAGGGPLSQPIDFSGSVERMNDGDSIWFARRGRMRLKPGDYRWSFAVRDDQTGLTSFLAFRRKLP